MRDGGLQCNALFIETDSFQHSFHGFGAQSSCTKINEQPSFLRSFYVTEVVLCTGELSRRPETARMVVTDSRSPEVGVC